QAQQGAQPARPTRQPPQEPVLRVFRSEGTIGERGGVTGSACRGSVNLSRRVDKVMSLLAFCEPLTGDRPGHSRDRRVLFSSTRSYSAMPAKNTKHSLSG